MKDIIYDILIHQNEERLNCGFDVWCVCDNALSDKVLTGKNASIAFKEILISAAEEEYETRFREEVQALESVRRELAESDRIFDMTVGKVSKYVVELIPCESKYHRYRFQLTADYHNTSFEWYPLATGDKVKVNVFAVKADLCACSVVAVSSRAVTSRKLVTVGPMRDKLNLDLQSMAGGALVQAVVEEKKENTYKGDVHQYLKMSIHGILLGGEHDTYWNNPQIFGTSTDPGAQYMMWVAKPTSDKKKFYKLSFTESEYHDKSMSDQSLSASSQERIVAVVYRLTNKSAVILAASLEPFVVSRVYVSDIENDGDWGKFIRHYVPLGFPVTFALDVEHVTKKHRLHLKGVNIKMGLKGRISNDTEAQNLKNRSLARNVLVSPHMLKEEDQAILVNSPEYAGWAFFTEIPQALLNYARCRIFTTKMQVPANVRIEGCVVKFDIKGALEEELQRIGTSVGKSEKMTVCSICLGKVYLTTVGGYPVEYTCRDNDEEVAIRKKMFKTMDFIIDGVAGDWVKVSFVSWFRDQVAAIDLHPGDFFYAEHIRIDSEDRWHVLVNGALDCVVLSETLDKGELLVENAKLMLVGINLEQRHLIAVAHPEKLVNIDRGICRADVICGITPELWLCSTGEKKLLMYSTEMGSSVLHHLKRLYGDHTCVDVAPVDGGKATKAIAGCIFNGVACGVDYAQLLARESIDLPVPISLQTPKVLFGDVILTASKEEIARGPMWTVNACADVAEDGTMRCSRGVSLCSNDETSSGYEASCIYKGVVVRTEDESIVFNVDGNEVAVLVESQMLSVFECGTEWALECHDGAYEVSTSCPKRISRYTLLKKIRGVRGRSALWIAKHESGALAKAEIKDFDYKEGEDVLLQLCGDSVSDQFDFKGLKLPLVFDRKEDGNMVCHMAGGITLFNEYLIPEVKWGWYDHSYMEHDMPVFHGCAFVAKVKDYDIKDSQAILDRRCLLKQNELLPSSTVSGNYQMTVSGCCKQGYILQHNGVTVTLPWAEVSLCDIPKDEFIRRDFFGEGALVEVGLQYDEVHCLYKVKWRNLPQMRDIADQWSESIKDGYSFPATIDHIGHNVLYLDIEGVPMFITSAQLGLWEGTDLTELYEVGQYIECWLETSSPRSFSVSLRQLTDRLDIPLIYSQHMGTFVRYISEDSLDCVVEFGKWMAMVTEADLTWEPVPDGTKPYLPGDTVPIRVENIDSANMRIMASVVNAVPRPQSGPASENWEEHPELRWFVFEKVNEKGHIWVKDDIGRQGIMFNGGDYTCPTADLVNKMKKEGGCWLVLKGVRKYAGKVCYGCAYLQNDSVLSLESTLHNLPKGEKLKKKVKIRRVSRQELLVSDGIAMGKITAEHCTGQKGTDLTRYYKEGDEVECVILFVRNLMFYASIINMYPNGFADLLGRLAVGKTASVKVYGSDDTCVYVQIRGTHLQGIIPKHEVSHNLSRDHKDWAAERLDDFVNVVCVDINHGTREISFSRKRVLAEGVEE